MFFLSLFSGFKCDLVDLKPFAWLVSDQEGLAKLTTEEREMAKNLGLKILLLVIILVSCSKSNDCALASPQKSRPSSG